MARPNVARVEFDPYEMNRFIHCMMSNTGVCANGYVRNWCCVGVYLEFEDVNGKVHRVMVDRESAHIDPSTKSAVATIHNFKPTFDINEAYISFQCRGGFYRIAKIVPPQGQPVFKKGEVYDFDLVVNFAPLEEAKEG